MSNMTSEQPFTADAAVTKFIEDNAAEALFQRLTNELHIRGLLGNFRITGTPLGQNNQDNKIEVQVIDGTGREVLTIYDKNYAGQGFIVTVGYVEEMIHYSA